MAVADDHVTWFRNSSPYINAHRGRTFVVMLPGAAVAAPDFHHIVHDLTLLSSLGIRLVLVHGAREQVSRSLASAGIDCEFDHHTRITKQDAMEPLLEVVGGMRFKLEGLFSMGLANSPMYNSSVHLVGGNFVVAKPVGVRNGQDYQYTGEVRRIQIHAINQQLELGNIVLLAPIGCSSTGELFNLNAEEVASAAAISLEADKLIIMGDQDGIHDAAGKLLRELSPHEALQLLVNDQISSDNTQRQLTAACHAASNGVARSHLVAYNKDGALLHELFTRDGCGTMITLETFESIRNARIEDVGGILELIEPLEAIGTLVKRSRERLENEIHLFAVIERDGTLIGCAALYPFGDSKKTGELACVAIHPGYQNQRRAGQLLRYLEKRARRMAMTDLFALTTRAAHWFQEHGFEAAEVVDLPGERRSLYNFQRNSKIFRKKL